MKSESPIHYRYVILILTLIIISLLTFRYAADTQLYNYVSFAATIASLILAVLAIIYAIYSNNNFSSTISTLDKSTLEIKSSSDEIRNNSKQLNDVIEQLKKQYDTIPVLISDLGIKIDKQSINALSTEIIDNTKTQKHITADISSSFLQKTSATGIIGLYGLAKALDKKKSFTLKDIVSESETVHEWYLFGFFIAASSVGITQFTVSSEFWTVNGIEFTLPRLEKRIVDSLKKYEQFPEWHADLLSFKQKIDDFFI